MPVWAKHGYTRVRLRRILLPAPAYILNNMHFYHSTRHCCTYTFTAQARSTKRKNTRLCQTNRRSLPLCLGAEYTEALQDIDAIRRSIIHYMLFMLFRLLSI